MLPQKVGKALAVDRPKALTQVRQLLKLVNFYVRDRTMSSVLRRSILTTSGNDLSKEAWDRHKWDATV